MSNNRPSEFIFWLRVLTVVAAFIATVIAVLAFIPQVSLAARVQMSPRLWMSDLFGLLSGMIFGSGLMHFLMGSRIYAYGRIDDRTMWAPSSKTGRALKTIVFVLVCIAMGIFGANVFLADSMRSTIH